MISKKWAAMSDVEKAVCALIYLGRVVFSSCPHSPTTSSPPLQRPHGSTKREHTTPNTAPPSLPAKPLSQLPHRYVSTPPSDPSPSPESSFRKGRPKLLNPKHRPNQFRKSLRLFPRPHLSPIPAAQRKRTKKKTKRRTRGRPSPPTSPHNHLRVPMMKKTQKRKPPPLLRQRRRRLHGPLQQPRPKRRRSRPKIPIPCNAIPFLYSPLTLHI